MKWEKPGTLNPGSPELQADSLPSEPPGKPFRRSPGEGNGNPLQYPSLENSMDKEPGGLQSMGSQRVGHN